MKFTGLILICAAGALALILPAAGVVKFPMHTGQAQTVPAETTPTPVSMSLSGSLPPSAGLSSAGLPALSQPVGAQLAGTQNETASLFSSSVASADFWNKQSLCMGFWLLLGPVAILGLALWTFSPGPKPNAV